MEREEYREESDKHMQSEDASKGANWEPEAQRTAGRFSGGRGYGGISITVEVSDNRYKERGVWGRAQSGHLGGSPRCVVGGGRADHPGIP